MSNNYCISCGVEIPDGTAHASGYYYCGELDLRDSDKSDRLAEVWITSGTTDKLTGRLTYKQYTR